MEHLEDHLSVSGELITLMRSEVLMNTTITFLGERERGGRRRKEEGEESKNGESGGEDAWMDAPHRGLGSQWIQGGRGRLPAVAILA